MTTHLDRELILRAFRSMARQLERKNARGEIVLAEQAVMALQYDVERVTRDVDGLIVKGHDDVTAAAMAAGAELGLPRGWLNGGVSVYLSAAVDIRRSLIFDHSNLIVYASSAQHMLALKARAARAQDLGDLKVLIGILKLETAKDVLAIVEEFFPDDALSPRATAALQDLFS